jgi:hypothetical protein
MRPDFFIAAIVSALVAAFTHWAFDLNIKQTCAVGVSALLLLAAISSVVSAELSERGL